MAANLDLWPRPLVIIANPAAYQRLTEDQRAIMATAAKDTIPVALEAERSDDAAATTALCKAGLTFTTASESDLVALHKAVNPVYDAIGKKPANSDVLTKITTIKSSMHRAPDTADCSNTATGGSAASRYDGTYEMRVVWPKINTADARCIGGPEAGPGGAIYDIVLDKGTLVLWIRIGGPDAQRDVGFDASYEFFKDQLVLNQGQGNDRLVFDFTYKDRILTLSNLRGGECGDRAIWTTKPWVRQ